jgi:hypothetical protein
MPCDLSERVFAEWQAIFASRIGRPQLDSAQVADYKAYCRVFDSDEDFEAAAQYVYERWKAWDAWPAPIEFESARVTLRRVPDAEIKATYAQYIAPARQLPPPKSEAVSAFGRAWRDALTRAGADPESLEQERRASRRAVHADDWLTDERRAACAPDVVDSVEALQNHDADREGGRAA